MTNLDLTFISKANTKHNYQYDYSDVVYLNARHKVNIICPIHGLFMIKPTTHLNGQGCPGCRRKKHDIVVYKIYTLHNQIITKEDIDIFRTEYKNRLNNKLLLILDKLDIDTNNTNKIFYILNNLTSIPKCKTCNNELLDYSKEYCSNLCSANSDHKKLKIKQTNIDRYGVDNVLSSPIFRYKSMITHYIKTGFYHNTHNPDVIKKYKRKEYILPSGKKIMIQGYENKFLDHYFSYGSEDDICYEATNIPVIPYILDDKEHKYFPDFYINSTNTIIEVKSDYTILQDIQKNTLKFEATIYQGYNIKIYVFTSDDKFIILDV